MLRKLFAMILSLTLVLGLLAGCTEQKPVRDIGPLLAKEGQEGYYLEAAKFAVEDLLDHFWMGSEKTGRFHPTHTGAALDKEERGVVWESAMQTYTLFDLWTITGEQRYETLLKAEADFYRNDFSAEELEDPEGPPGPASDDCSWTAMLLMIFYDVTGDEWFLDRTINLLDNVRQRWYDPELNGLYYKDGVDFMSLYECGITLTWLHLWEITGQQRFYDLAFGSYNGLHDRMIREDGIYIIEANLTTDPDYTGFHVTEAGSSTSLFGNMAMATLSAKFYQITGEQVYLDRVHATNAGIAKWYDVDGDGVLLNDRDAWTEGTFASYYASNVLTLEGTEEMQELLLGTARSIMRNDRTADGRYGGSWQGPAEGTDSIWHSKGSTASQAHTNASTIMIVTAAAMLEAGVEDFAR